MKRRLLLLSALVLMSVGLSAQTLVFHLAGGAKSTVSLPATFTVTPVGNKLVIDSDGNRVELDDGDVTCITYRAKSGDVNGDKLVDVADIATVLRIMAGYKPDDVEPVNPGQAPENAKAVDLGLPSGTLWANMNVGATSPQENGLYFAWGETTGYTGDTSDGRLFDWANYKWMTTDSTTWMGVNKYQIADGQTDGCWYQYDWDLVDYKFVGDGKSVLDLEDDAARANWGGDWCMPTVEDFKELMANTTSEWITVGGVSGYRIKSKKANADGTYNSIFFPAAGRLDPGLGFQGEAGYYWTATVAQSASNQASIFNFSSGHLFTVYANSRYRGLSVRPVLKN